MIEPTPAVGEITLRDLFALGCMMAHVNARRDYAPANDAAPWYYAMADDMMKARQNETR